MPHASAMLHACLGRAGSSARRIQRIPMLRISHYLRALAQPEAAPACGAPAMPVQRPPVVIWNLLRRCNLTCKPCYATTADSPFRNELSTTEALRVIDDLTASGVRILILSGGEPLLRADLFQLAGHADRKSTRLNSSH